MDSAESANPSFADVDFAGRPVKIEFRWIAGLNPEAPLVVFLHEGLGSLSTWRDFPQALCEAAGTRGLVYSRPGYGRSTRHDGSAWKPDYLHRQAHELLPALLKVLGVDAAAHPPWLLGHSDGGSIALIHAAHHPEQVAGAILLAPHIMVEDLSVTSIAESRNAYRDTDMSERLAKHHDDPGGVFWRWNDIWLHPDFRSWSIEQEIGAIRCPLLAVQGLDDPYGTLAQVRGIAQRLPQTELLTYPDCAHSPQRDQREALLRDASAFVRRTRQAS